MVESDVMRKLLKGEGPLWLPLLSGSMAPSLLPNDELFIETDFSGLKIGEIAVFFSNGKFYSHRILLKLRFLKKSYVLEKGDANYTASLIPVSKVLGKVTKMRRDGKISDLSDPREVLEARRKALRSFLKLLRIRRWRWR